MTWPELEHQLRPHRGPIYGPALTEVSHSGFASKYVLIASRFDCGTFFTSAGINEGTLHFKPPPSEFL
ncbi:hypothetical protein DMENIID0001_156780 [Sergentomyia squamirostris]